MTRLFALLLFPAIAWGQCVTYGEPVDLQVRMMGYNPGPVEWKSVNYVVHIHYTDSFPYQYSQIGEAIVWDAHDHLNEEFEEALFSFDLISIEYHNLDEVEGMAEALALYSTCVPYSYYGWSTVENYLEDIVWDREHFMNVHVFPQFCSGILGFAWTAYADTPFDGAWVRSNVFGRIGDHLWGDRDENKTLIHEVGHYLSLHHVFKGVDYCGQDLGPCEETGDYVCDTPPIKTSWSCENPVCPPGAYNYTPDNHMDYYVDSCRHHFTEGQIERMHNMIAITRPGLTDADPYCAGDVSGDYVVGQNDMLLMLANFGDSDWIQGDVNGDGVFTVLDFQAMLANWGTVCFGAEQDAFYRQPTQWIRREESSLLRSFPPR